MSEGNDEAANNVQHQLGSAHFLPHVEESAKSAPPRSEEAEEDADEEAEEAAAASAEAGRGREAVELQAVVGRWKKRRGG